MQRSLQDIGSSLSPPARKDCFRTLGTIRTMDTKIPAGLPGVDLHSTSKHPHVVLGVTSTTAIAQAHPDDKVHYLQQVLLVSITRAIMMCARIVLRPFLRLSQKGVHGVSCCLTNWTGYANWSRLAVKVARTCLITPSGLRRHLTPSS